MKTSWVWILVGVACLAILTLYFAVFHGNLSAISQDWASFGGYVSGIMMPILTAINIWVFINLTKAIDSNTNDRQKEELAFQKRKIITEMRHQELDRLLVMINEIGTKNDPLENMMFYIKCGMTIDAFLNQKQELFPIEETSDAYTSLLKINNSVSALRDLTIKVVSGITDYVSADNQGAEKYEEHIRVIVNNKHKALAPLQKYIIDNI